jgi:hypothetical protein
VACVRERLEKGRHGFVLERLHHGFHLFGLAAAHCDGIIIICDKACHEVIRQFNRRFLLLLDTKRSPPQPPPWHVSVGKRI